MSCWDCSLRVMSYFSYHVNWSSTASLLHWFSDSIICNISNCDALSVLRSWRSIMYQSLCPVELSYPHQLGQLWPLQIDHYWFLCKAMKETKFLVHFFPHSTGTYDIDAVEYYFTFSITDHAVIHLVCLHWWAKKF